MKRNIAISFCIVSLAATGCFDPFPKVPVNTRVEEEEPDSGGHGGGGGSLPIDVDEPSSGTTINPGSHGIEPGGEEEDGEENPGEVVIVEPLSLSEVTPDHGSTAGGYMISIQGKSISRDARVTIGVTEAPDLLYVTKGLVRVRVPQGHRGCVDVTVTNGDGASRTLEKAFCYTERLSIDQVEPAVAEAGVVTLIHVEGSGFEDEMSFYVRGSDGEYRALLEANLNGDSVDGILPELPPGPASLIASTGESQVVVEGALDILPELRIEQVNPRVVPAEGRTGVSLSGAGLTDGKYSVLVGSSSAGVNSAVESVLSFDSPALPSGCYALTVSDGLRTATASPGLYVADDLSSAEIMSVVPSRGPLTGMDAVIVGTSLSPNSGVTFGSNVAETGLVSGAALPVRVPPATLPGAVDVHVGSETLHDGFVYVSTPEFDRIEPSAGGEGTQVSIAGGGFDGSVRLYAGGLEISDIQVLEDGELTAVMPAGSGTVSLKYEKDGVQGDTGLTFRYVEEPAVYGVSPSEVAVMGGTRVEIYGSGLTDGLIVTLNGYEVDYTLDNPGKLSFYSPELEPGEYSLVVSTPDGEVLYSAEQLYYEPSGLNTHVSGGLLEGRMNVTVLTVSTSEPISGAEVWVTAGTEMLHGYTNDYAQVSFEDSRLTGSQILYACHEGYSCNTIQTFDGRDVTIYLDPWIEPGSPSSSVDPPPPPDPSGDEFSINPIDVVVTVPAQSSYITGKVGGFGKVTLESDPNTVRAAIVLQSQLGPYDGSRDKDDVYMLFEEKGMYRIKARKGDVALGLLCGLYNTQTGQFDPRFFGVRTGLYVTNGVTLTADLDCPLPLTQTQRVKLLNLPEGEHTRVIRSRGYLNLNNYGYIGGFMTGISDTDYVVLTHVPPLRDQLEHATIALQTDLVIDNSSVGTVSSYGIEKDNSTVEVGPLVSWPEFDRLPEDNYYSDAAGNEYIHNGELILRRGSLTWHTNRPEYVDFYSLEVYGYYSGSGTDSVSVSGRNLLWQEYLPGNATNAEFLVDRDYTWHGINPSSVYFVLTAYKTIRNGYDFNNFTTLDTKHYYIDSSVSTTLYLPWNDRSPSGG